MNGTEPRIRFKEFGGAWEADKLSRHLSVSEERNEDNRYGATDVFSVSREHGIVNQIEFQGRSFAGASLLGYRVIHKGQVAYTKSPLKAAPYGIVKADKTKSGIVSALYGVYDAIADADFVQTFFENDDRLNAYLRPLVNKGAKNTLLVSDEDALSGEVRFPSLPEQRRIAELFRNLDETIAATDARLEKLRQSKKSLLEKMFPRPGASVPEIRFKGFEGEWETRKLGEAFPDSIPNNTFSRAALSDSGIVRNVHYGDVLIRYGSVLDVATAKMPFVGDTGFDPQKQCLLRNGDIVIADTAEDSAVGKMIEIQGIHGEKVVSGLHTIALRPAKLFGMGFVGQYLNSESFHHQLLPIMQGVKVLSIGKKVLAETRLQIPSLPEQQRIGAFFCEFDKLIESVQKKAAKFRQVKSALLEEMFV